MRLKPLDSAEAAHLEITSDMHSTRLRSDFMTRSGAPHRTARHPTAASSIALASYHTCIALLHRIFICIFICTCNVTVRCMLRHGVCIMVHCIIIASSLHCIALHHHCIALHHHCIALH